MPRPGPCSPWITAADVLSSFPVQKAIAASPFDPDSAEAQSIAAEACAAASEILFNRSGKVYTGLCGPVTVRPVARPLGTDTASWLGGGASWGLGVSWGSCSWYGLGAGGVSNHFGNSEPPVIPLDNYPVREITLVKIDGVTIPSDEYELRNHKELIRLRPTSSFQPTERWGWPTSQIGDLPDTQQGTFSVTYTFGQDPGAGGRRACRKLAEALAIPDFGGPSQFPGRVTSVQRQGVSAVVADVEDLIKSGNIGIPEVDIWLTTVNPTKAAQQSKVWSPDIGRPRRQAIPSTS